MLKKKTTIILLIMVIIFGAGLAGLAVYERNSPSLDFQTYAPQVLPSGLQITNKTVDIWSSKTNPLTSRKILKLQLNVPKGYISQAEKSDYDSGVVSCEFPITNQTCGVRKTPLGQNYKMESTFGGDKQLLNQTLRWFKADTYIWLSLDSDSRSALTETEIEQLIDSFRPVNYTNLATKHYAPGP